MGRARSTTPLKKSKSKHNATHRQDFMSIPFTEIYRQLPIHQYGVQYTLANSGFCMTTFLEPGYHRKMSEMFTQIPNHQQLQFIQFMLRVDGTFVFTGLSFNLAFPRQNINNTHRHEVKHAIDLICRSTVKLDVKTFKKTGEEMTVNDAYKILAKLSGLHFDTIKSYYDNYDLIIQLPKELHYTTLSPRYNCRGKNELVAFMESKLQEVVSFKKSYFFLNHYLFKILNIFIYTLYFFTSRFQMLLMLDFLFLVNY